MSNSIAPGSSADVNVKVTALTTNPNVPVTYKTVILKKNLVNGVNTLTQEMMSATNTKYVIKYNYVLGEDISVPVGCILEFDGGSILASGSNDTITGANTSIQAGLVKILNTDVTLAGTWNVAEAYPEWFGAIGDGVTDCTSAFEKCMNTFLKTVCGCSENKKYIFNDIIDIRNQCGNRVLYGGYSTLENFKCVYSAPYSTTEYLGVYAPIPALNVEKCQFGKIGALENNALEPAFISGGNIFFRDVMLCNKFVLVAVTNDRPDNQRAYIDRFSMIDCGLFIEDHLITRPSNYGNYCAVMGVDADGTLTKESLCNGDNWRFVNCYNFSGHDNNNTRYGLIKCSAKRPIYFEQTSSYIELQGYSKSSFINCRWEHSDSGVYLHPDVSVEGGGNAIFINCAGYITSSLPIDKRCTYIGCNFGFGTGDDIRGFQITKSLLKTCKIVNCEIENAIVSSDDNDFDIGSNYIEGVPSVGTITFNVTPHGRTYNRLTSNCSVVVHYKNFEDMDVCYSQNSGTFDLYTNDLLISIPCNPCLVDVYITDSNGVIRKASVKTSATGTLKIKIFGYLYNANYDIADFLSPTYKRIYPLIDTLEVVNSVPTLITNTTTFRVSDRVLVDTTDSFAITNNSVINKDYIRGK